MWKKKRNEGWWISNTNWEKNTVNENEMSKYYEENFKISPAAYNLLLYALVSGVGMLTVGWIRRLT